LADVSPGTRFSGRDPAFKKQIPKAYRASGDSPSQARQVGTGDRGCLTRGEFFMPPGSGPGRNRVVPFFCRFPVGPSFQVKDQFQDRNRARGSIGPSQKGMVASMQGQGPAPPGARAGRGQKGNLSPGQRSRGGRETGGWRDEEGRFLNDAAFPPNQDSGKPGDMQARPVCWALAWGRGRPDSSTCLIAIAPQRRANLADRERTAKAPACPREDWAVPAPRSGARDWARLNSASFW